MTEHSLKTPVVVLGRGGPSLVDLRLQTSAIRLVVTSPGMLVAKLRLATSLDMLHGATEPALRALREELDVLASCGHTPPARVELAIERTAAGASLVFDVGPSSMYQTEILLRTRTGDSLESTLRRALFTAASDPEAPFLAALIPEFGALHAAHSHAPAASAEPDHSMHDHMHHGGAHGHS